MSEQTLTVSSGQAQLAVTAGGDGPALVFIHSGVTDQRGWEAQISHFRKGYQTVTLDLRGYGETVAPPEPYSSLQDLLAVMNALSIDKAVLIGNSKGGRLSLDFALAYPQRVRALVLIAPAISGAPKVEQWPPEVQRYDVQVDAAYDADDLDAVNELEAGLWLDGLGSSQPRVSGPVRDLFLDMNGRALRAAPVGDELPPEHSAYARLSQIRVPTLLVTGDLDLPHMQANAEHAARTIPDARLHVMHGAAHLPQLEQPAAFNALLSAFLRSLP